MVLGGYPVAETVQYSMRVVGVLLLELHGALLLLTLYALHVHIV